MGFLLPTTKISTSQGKTSEFGITSSEYDKEIPFGFGQDRYLGNIIWANNIVEEKSTTTQTTGGKGSPKQQTTTTTFLYYVDLAALICEGPIESVSRIWADGKIVFDAFNGEQIDGLQFRLYTGSETQLPDPLIEESVGVNNTPAYRGICYIVFERFPLANFGNRIPAFSFEVFSGDVVAALQREDHALLTDAGGAGGVTLFDRLTGRAYGRAGVPNSSSEDWLVFDPNTGLKLGELDPPSVSNALVGIANDGNLIVAPTTSSLGRDIAKWSAVDLSQIKITRPLSRVAAVAPIPGIAQDIWLMRKLNDVFSDEGFELLNFTTAPSGSTPNAPLLADILTVAGEDVTNPVSGDTGEAFVAIYSATQIKLYRATSGGVVLARTFLPSEIDASAVNFDLSTFSMQLHYDTTLKSLIMAIATDTGNFMWRWSTNNVTSWISQNLAFLPQPNVAGGLVLDGGTWAWARSQRVISINLTTGEVDDLYDGSTVFDGSDSNPEVLSFSINNFTSIFWHGPSDSFYLANSNPGLGPTGYFQYTLAFGAEGGSDMDPQSVVRQMCLRSGLSESDIDVSQVPTSKAGLRSLIVTERGTAADAVGPLLDLLEIEVVESDFVLKFFPRGGASAQTIPEADLVPTQDNEGEPYLRAFIEEDELPRRFEVGYRDIDLDYQESVQADERSSVTQFSQTVDSFAYNGACDPDLPRQSAQVKLYAAWAERERVRSRLPQRYLHLDAGDVITLNLDNGDTIEGRMRRADIGANFNIEMEQVVETTGLYLSEITGAGSDNHFQANIPNTGDSLVFIIDGPLLRDQDSAGQEQTVTYWASNGQPTWPGVILFRQTGSSTVSEVGKQLQGAAHGVLETAPTDMDETVNRFVEESFQITVTQGIDSFESVDDDDVLAGRNLLAIVRDGNIEYLQFANATIVDTDTVEVSRLLRGRRGTDALASGHQVGDAVYLLDATVTDIFSEAVSIINSTQTYRPVTIGQLYEDAEDVSYTDTGRDLKPYSPVHIALADDGASGLDLSWVRRTRIGGEDDFLLSGDVPLSEQSESYEVDILDGPGGTVLRTLASATETVNYAAADIATDFGSLPAQLSVVVYQISAVVGRGFPGDVTLETT